MLFVLTKYQHKEKKGKNEKKKRESKVQFMRYYLLNSSKKRVSFKVRVKSF